MRAINERFKEARESAGMTPAQWARAIQVSKANVTRMESVAKSASPETLEAIEEVSGFRQAYILRGELPKKAEDGLEPVPVESLRRSPYFQGGQELVKFTAGSYIREGTAGGPARVLTITTIEGLEMDEIAERPGVPGTAARLATAQAWNEQAYALRITGDRFNPRFRHGEVIVVQPGPEVQPGTDAVVILADGRKLIKRMKWTRAGAVSLEPVNGTGPDITLPMERVARMDAIVDIVPAAAFELQ